MVKVGFKKLHPDAIIPTFGHSDMLDAGLDFYALHSTGLKAGGSVVMGTGIAWDGSTLVTDTEKPELLMQSRSGLAFKECIEASNAGLIDATYTGEIKVKLYNFGEWDYYIAKGDRIAQGVVRMLPRIEPVEVSSLAVTPRGANGIGSTGK